MKKNIKKRIICLLIFAAFCVSLNANQQVFAAKAKKMTQEEFTQLSNNIAFLTKKIYANGLFSPKDNETIIDAKEKLDTALLGGGGKYDLAQAYYKLAYVYRNREYRDDAIECYQTILENFQESPYYLKSVNELKKMGVKVASPTEESASEN